MMKFFFYMFFLILFSSFFDWLFVVLYIMFGFFFFFNICSFFTYFSSLSYFMGGDLLSFSLVFLTIWIIFLMIISSHKLCFFNKGFVMVILFLMFFLVLSFFCYNIFVFYIFFECSLIPTLLLIFGWGYQPERLSSGYYLLFYTLFGSFPLLLSIFFIYSFVFTLFYDLIFVDFNFYIYLGLILSFLIKMPIFFFHFWLPKAHVEAPISGSMILAGVLLKMGGYGLFRVFSFIYLSCFFYNFYFVVFSLLGVFYSGFICFFQSDIKSLIAYSSVVHMGLVICGIFTLNSWGLMGSLVMMIGHGLCSSGMFCLANIVYDRTNSRSFYVNKGLINIMPSLSFFWFLFCSNNMSSPMTLNLIGELMLINSLLSWCTFSFLFLFFGSFFSCCYNIYLYSNTQHGFSYSGLSYFFSINVREFMLLLFHLFPLNFLFFKLDIFTFLL